MSIGEYQEAARRTCATTSKNETIKLALIGLQGELGEIAEPLKKHLYSGHDLDLRQVQSEIGDLLWYLATLGNALDISLGDALISNLEKLRKRYPDGFSPEKSVNRTTSSS